jgi:hypothetical protein
MQKKLMQVREWGDGSSCWRVACDCLDPDHDAELFFENDDEAMTTLHLSMHVGFYPRWTHTFGSWWHDKMRRVAHAARVLWSGHAQLQGTVLLDEEGIKALQLALSQAMDHAARVKSQQTADTSSQ